LKKIAVFDLCGWIDEIKFIVLTIIAFNRYADKGLPGKIFEKIKTLSGPVSYEMYNKFDFLTHLMNFKTIIAL
jgi:hypothetical protein